MYIPRKQVHDCGKILLLQLQNGHQDFEFFSFARAADNSFEVKDIEIWAPEFFEHNNSFLTILISFSLDLLSRSTAQEFTTFEK